MDFSEALVEMKKGTRMLRTAWKNKEIAVSVQFPDEHSKNTLPYLIMEKKDACFPLDLSCESIFAEDWEPSEWQNEYQG